MQAQDILAKARFEAQLVEINKTSLDFRGEIAQDNLPGKVKKPKWAKTHRNASARSHTRALGSQTETSHSLHSAYLAVLTL